MAVRIEPNHPARAIKLDTPNPLLHLKQTIAGAVGLINGSRG